MLLTGKTWRLSASRKVEDAEALLGVLLKNRGIAEGQDEEQFLSEEDGIWHDPFLYNDMRKAVDIINETIDRHGKVLVYGFGGAARTIITECLKAGCDVSVGTSSERMKKASDVIKELEDKGGKKIRLVSNEQITEKYDLFINTSPIGMYPNIGISPIRDEQIELFDYVYDIVYNPQDTELLKLAKEKGKVCGGGLSMLVCQAEKAHTIWYGAEFSEEETERVIAAAAREMKEVFGV